MKSTVDETTDKVIKRLQQIGEKCVNIARANGDYEDITGNLRSSIGYIVLRDGVPVTQNIIEPTNVTPGRRAVERIVKGKKRTVNIKVGGDGSGGTKAASELLDKLKSKYSTGCVLIVVAGMEYAAYVENVHGKHVLVDSRLLAEELADRYFGKRNRMK